MILTATDASPFPLHSFPSQTMQTITVPTTQQTAKTLEQIARNIAPYVALLIAAALHTYSLGYRLGKWLHSLNDKLATNWPSRPQQSRQESPQKPPTIASESPRKAPKITPDTIEGLVADLLAQGCSQREASRRLGISRQKIAKITRFYKSELIKNQQLAIFNTTI